jgi:O-antigen chain-terminating methyltransferase
MTTDTTSETPAAPERPDVDDLMARVRAGVAAKLASGVYTHEEIERVRTLALAIRERSELGPDATDDVTRLHETWDPLAPHVFATHRPGLAGRLVVKAKGLLYAALKPVAATVLVRQTEFNGAVTRLLTGATHQLQTLEALILKHEELARRHRELQGRHGELLTEVRGLRARLEAVDRAALPAAALAPPAAAAPPARPPADADADAAPLSYLAFEEKHRGPAAAIKEKQRAYLRHFAGAPGRVLDAGCGRGEFLELLAEAGVAAYGVDLDPEMAARAREKGLSVETGDLLAHLGALPDGSLGGIFAAQVIEHMTTPELVSFVRLAHAKLAPGGSFLAETVNPACLATFAGAFYLDLTHVRPVHPEALRFLLEGSGFREVALEFTSPFPADMKLQELDLTPWVHDVDREMVRVVNENFGRLNGVIYGFQDFAAVGRR